MNNGDLPAGRVPCEITKITSEEDVLALMKIDCGLTKREAFAMAALQGVLANSWVTQNAPEVQEKLGLKSPSSVYVGFALESADAMLKALEDSK